MEHSWQTAIHAIRLLLAGALIVGIVVLFVWLARVFRQKREPEE